MKRRSYPWEHAVDCTLHPTFVLLIQTNCLVLLSNLAAKTGAILIDKTTMCYSIISCVFMLYFVFTQRETVFNIDDSISKLLLEYGIMNLVPFAKDVGWRHGKLLFHSLNSFELFLLDSNTFVKLLTIIGDYFKVCLMTWVRQRFHRVILCGFLMRFGLCKWFLESSKGN